MNNLHWTVVAEHKKGRNYQTIKEGPVISIQVNHLKTEKEAIERAKELVERDYFYLKGVAECNCEDK